jgi:molybdopterin-synthase adenylyltransferase
VLAPVVGVIGSIQATETIKLLSGMGETLGGRLLVWDAMTMEWRTLKLKKDPACPVCSRS